MKTLVLTVLAMTLNVAQAQSLSKEEFADLFQASKAEFEHIEADMESTTLKKLKLELSDGPKVCLLLIKAKVLSVRESDYTVLNRETYLEDCGTVEQGTVNEYESYNPRFNVGKFISGYTGLNFYKYSKQGSQIKISWKVEENNPYLEGSTSFQLGVSQFYAEVKSEGLIVDNILIERK